MSSRGNTASASGLGSLYLYEQRLLIVWEFDESGRVLCEDSDSGGGAGFCPDTGISSRTDS